MKVQADHSKCTFCIGMYPNLRKYHIFVLNSFTQSRGSTPAENGAIGLCTAHAVKSQALFIFFLFFPPDWCDFFCQKLSHRYVQLQPWWGLRVLVYQYCSLCPQVLPTRSSNSLAISFALWYVPGLASHRSSSLRHLLLPSNTNMTEAGG